MDFDTWYEKNLEQYKWRWEFLRRSSMFRSSSASAWFFHDEAGRPHNPTHEEIIFLQTWGLPLLPSPMDHSHLYRWKLDFKGLVRAFTDDIEYSDEPLSCLYNGKRQALLTDLKDLAVKINLPDETFLPYIRFSGPFKKLNAVEIVIHVPEVYGPGDNILDHISDFILQQSFDQVHNVLTLLLPLASGRMVPPPEDPENWKAWQEKYTLLMLEKVSHVEDAIVKAFNVPLDLPVDIFNQRRSITHLEDQLLALDGIDETDNPARTLKAAQEKIKRLEQGATARFNLLLK